MTARGRYIGIALLIAGAWLSASACKDDKRDQAQQADEDKAGAASQTAPASRAPRQPGPAETRTVSEPERVVVSQVALQVVDPADSPPRELYPRELGQKLGQQLSQSPFFAARVEDVPASHRAREATLEVRIGYDVVDSPERGGRVIMVAIESQVVWADSGSSTDIAPGVNVLAERLLAAGERDNEDGVIAVFVADTLARVGHDLVAKEQVRVGDTEALEQALESTDVDMVLWGLDLIADRGRRDLFDRVLTALASDEDLIRDRALTTLVALGDPRAVDALAKRAAFGDHEFMRMVIEAVTALGGDDARAYLEFIASGHPEDDLRARARDGLERLERARARTP